MTAGSDKDLGMDRPIARRDFLQGAAIGVGGMLLGGLAPELVAAAAEIAEQDRASTTTTTSAVTPSATSFTSAGACIC